MSVPSITSRIALASRDTGGTIGIVENVVQAGWPGPPLHHHAFDETFCVLEGELTFQLGAERDNLARWDAGVLGVPTVEGASHAAH